MATCPCGCTRRVGWMAKRTALHAVDIGLGIAVLQRLSEIEPQIPEEGRPQVTDAMLSAGRTMQWAMLQQAHGDPSGQDLLPSPGDLREWQAAVNPAAWDSPPSRPVVGDGPERQLRRALPVDGDRRPGLDEPDGSMRPGASITFLGPCYQCWTESPPRSSQAVTRTELPPAGVVTICMLCEDCLADPRAERWLGWLRQGAPAPTAAPGQLLVQTIGICLHCFSTMSAVSDLTGVSGQRMAPSCCSGQCDIEARKRLDG